MTTFSERLKHERKRLGLNQEEFAAHGGVKRYAQLNYENGTRKPDSDYLEAIAALGVDVLFVLTGRCEAGSLPSDEVELLRRYREASDALKAAALGALIGGAAPSKVQQNFHSGVNIGQQVMGDIKTPQTFSFGGSKKKK
ncbi:helix-turn-helix transcriptional regulator [Pandoraea nosoerga]|nr:helix-turn-helix transcriptional regulator [Pandoraea nosoerga]MBN4677180.1 helix-turn-helix transcriptional regulator [Pandoraea nosoerga]MBN4681999.1 helix-turn-helix transcriptional regulator [Pandoraea nosoerga]MBN4746317.1 helix-turn-helix transcriptional regulator [Pandoraea nosoerga]